MADRTLSNPKISVLWNSIVKDIIGNKEDGVSGVKIEDTINGSLRQENCEGVFMAIGHTPNSQLFKDYLELDNNGYIKTKPDSTRTNIDGVFACGDVQDHVYRQAVTAAGTGCMAAIEAERWIENN